MKKTGSYLLLPLLLGVYLATNMGFDVHICSKEGSSKVIFLSKRSPCGCPACQLSKSNDQEVPECCRQYSDEKECHERCCQTIFYIIEDAQDCVDAASVEAPTLTLDLYPPIIANELCIPHYPTIAALCTACIVRGPDGGLTSVTPLRL